MEHNPLQITARLKSCGQGDSITFDSFFDPYHLAEGNQVIGKGLISIKTAFFPIRIIGIWRGNRIEDSGLVPKLGLAGFQDFEHPVRLFIKNKKSIEFFQFWRERTEGEAGKPALHLRHKRMECNDFMSPVMPVGGKILGQDRR